MNIYRRSEVAKHNTLNDLWIILNNEVFNMTSYLSKHPGGTAPLRYSGQDATDIFPKIHAKNVLSRHMHLKIGVVHKDDVQDINAGGGVATAVSSSYYDVQADPDGYDRRTSDVDKQSREFGDHMAKEGETSHIPTIIIIMYLNLFVFSWLGSYVNQDCSMWTLPLFYVAGMVAFYLWHRLAHSEWYSTQCKQLGLPYLAEMHEMHMEHHLENFPPSDFYGSASLFAEMYPTGRPTLWALMDLTKTTRIASGTNLSNELSSKKKQGSSKGDSHSPLAHEWPLLAEMLIIILAGFWLGYSFGTMFFVFVLYFTMASVGNALHMSFHVRNFHLEKYAWYRELRSLHYIHHIGDMKSNLAMLNLGMDGLFHSLVVEDPRKKRGQKKNSGFYTRLVHSKKDQQFPKGITKASVLRSASHAGFVATVLGLDVPVDVRDSKAARRDMRLGYPTVLLRVLLVAGGMWLWSATETYFEKEQGAFAPPASNFVDPGHAFFQPVGRWLLAGDQSRAIRVVGISCDLSEIIVWALTVSSIAGRSFRPMLSIIFLFVLRLCMRALGTSRLIPSIATHVTEGSIVSMEVANVLPSVFVRHNRAVVGSQTPFFSSSVALTMVFALEMLSVTMYRKDLSNKIRFGAAFVGLACVSYDILLSMTLRTSWTFDVVVTVILARYCGISADRYAPWVDAFMP
jgi:hypothetical protein